MADKDLNNYKDMDQCELKKRWLTMNTIPVDVGVFSQSVRMTPFELTMFAEKKVVAHLIDRHATTNFMSFPRFQSLQRDDLKMVKCDEKIIVWDHLANSIGVLGQFFIVVQNGSKSLLVRYLIVGCVKSHIVSKFPIMCARNARELNLI